MSYKLIKGQNNFSCTYEKFFFNQERFLKKVEAEKQHSYFLLQEKKKKIIGEIHFFQNSEIAYSPLTGSFGAYQIDKNLKPERLSDFIKQVEVELSKEGVKKVFIRNYPVCYASNESQLINGLLLEKKYSLKYSDLNFHIDLKNEFHEGLRESEEARLRAAESFGFIFEKWESPDLNEVYNILKICRDQKNYPMSLSLPLFLEMFRSFPDLYTVFRVKKNNVTVAVAVALHVSSEICYNFYLGERPDSRRKSPAALLIKGMVEWAKNRGYKILDLGIGTDKGVSNFGLINFKQNMGGKASLKMFFEKDILL